MDNKWPKWKYQCWKSPAVWDYVILPRPFPDSEIRYVKCVDSITVVILSGRTDVEIWNTATGSVSYQEGFDDVIDYVDFIGIYQHEFMNRESSIKNCTVFIVNKNGLIISKQCDLSQSEIKVRQTNISLINKCFYKLILSIQSIVVVSKIITILQCSDLTIMMNITDPTDQPITCSLVTYDNIIHGSDQDLYFFQLSNNDEGNFEWKIIMRTNFHKNKIRKLIEIDDNCLASISSEAVKIWKRPDFNITRMFPIGDEFGGVNDKSILCLVYNSRYLTVSINCGYAIFDCINGSTLVKVTDAHDNRIIGIAYFNWLSMLFTLSEQGISRLWAFKWSNDKYDHKRNYSISPKQKNILISNYFSWTHSKSMDERIFLGKSLENCDKEFQQVSCFYESKHFVKSKNHFVNLEEIGALICDGTPNLLLWRNRDYALNGLVKMLQA